MNTVAISGNLTRDPELFETAAGPVCKFGLAWNQRKKQGDEYVDVAHFFDVSYFGRRGELMAAKAEKGNLVFVQGRLDYGSWEKDGEKRSKVTIVADVVEGECFFKKAGDIPAATPTTSSSPAAQDDDDIPF